MDIPVHLDRSQRRPLYRQLYDQIRDGIENGRLSPRTPLPSSRDLAARLHIGRNTVLDAYTRLVAEGYVEARRGSGTVIASSPPRAGETWRSNDGRPDRVPTPSPARLSRRMGTFPPRVEYPTLSRAPIKYDFRRWTIAAPSSEWQRILARHGTAFEPRRRPPRSPQGDLGLRTQIAQYLGAARAVAASPDQVVVTNNDQQARSLIAHLTLEPEDRVLVEEPGYAGARLLFQAHGAEVVGVPVDADGIDPVAVQRLATRRTRLLHVAPSHQYPTGVTLSRPRRLELLDWATTTGVFIAESDADSEYRYGDASLESLQGLDTNGVVIYFDSFSKVAGDAARLAYLVVPPAIVERAAALIEVIDRGTPPFLQTALAEFMASGLFGRHNRRMCRLHRARRDALRAALHDCFGDDVEIGPADAGIYIPVRWPHHPVTPTLVQAALRAQVGLYPAAPHFLRAPPRDPGVLMYYGGLDENQIREGIETLAQVLEKQPRVDPDGSLKWPQLSPT